MSCLIVAARVFSAAFRASTWLLSATVSAIPKTITIMDVPYFRIRCFSFLPDQDELPSADGCDHSINQTRHSIFGINLRGKTSHLVSTGAIRTGMRFSRLTERL